MANIPNSAVYFKSLTELDDAARWAINVKVGNNGRSHAK